MLQDISKLTLTIIVLFCLGLIFLMLNVVSPLFNVAFSGCFMIATLLVIIKSIKSYKIFTKQLVQEKQSTINDVFEMDIASTDYEKFIHFANKHYKQLKKERLMPIIFTGAMFLLMTFFTIKMVLTYII